MNGNDAYENKIIRRINNKLDSNRDLKCLRGYVNNISLSKSYSTVYTYLGIVVKFLRYIDKDYKDLCYDDYLSYLYLNKKLVSSAQILYYTALKELSSYLYNSDNAAKDYMNDIKPPKNIESIQTRNKRENNYLNSEELIQYINNVKNCEGSNNRERILRENWRERDIAIITLLLCTGMRCSALYKLNISDINLKDCSLLTVDKERRIEEHFYSKEVRDSLSDWIKLREKKLNGKSEDALFISKDLNRLSQTGIARITQKYSMNINGKSISPHKLRATYGTMIYEKTRDLYTVQQCMGHSDPSTSELYIRGQKNVGRKEAANIITDLLY